MCVYTKAGKAEYAKLVAARVDSLDPPITASEKAELERATASGTRFSIPREAAADAWGRAQVFVQQHSSMKIQTVSEYVIETFNPAPAPGQAFGYSITRSPTGDSFAFEIRCASSPARHPYLGEMYTKKLPSDCATNEVIAGHFIRTGELACARCIAK